MGNTSIQWTDKTWSPLRVRVKPDAGEIAAAKGYASLGQIATRMAGHVGPHCEHVSHGCDHCYSDTNNSRCLPSNGTGLPFDRRSRDLVESFVDEKILMQPLKWRKPVKVFVENQSDLFGEWATDEEIDRVFAVMALDYDMHWSEKEGNVRRPHHTFQVLTKRPARMKAYIERIISANRDAMGNWFSLPLVVQGCDISRRRGDPLPGNASIPIVQWIVDGMPGLWLGVSVEDQSTADTRIPLLLQTPATIRFVSYEPALGPVDFTSLPSASGIGRYLDSLSNGGVDPGALVSSKLKWIIVGGESGPGARPFDIEWARETIAQCRDAGVACFVKQLGATPLLPLTDPPLTDESVGRDWPEGTFFGNRTGIISLNGRQVLLKDRKGGDMAEWPEDLRVREFPEVARC